MLKPVTRRMSMSNNDLDLTGKVALVTGASKGIGAAIARIYAEHGASVMLSSRKIELLEATAATIDGDTAVFVANAGEPVQARDCVAATIERFGGLDILVNNAAANPYIGPAIDAPLSSFDKIVQVNVRGPLVWTQEAWRQSMSFHGGSVINVVSVGALLFSGMTGIYDMSKAALIHLTKQIAGEVGPKVRVNALAPGLVRTDFARVLWDREDRPDTWPWPLERLGEPIDIAGAALFLASDLSKWMTGDVLVVDGGSMVR
jgi:NAD(P)-dependent dehydrogenase (short-subunit alcohol dehydrogenase family)